MKQEKLANSSFQAHRLPSHRFSTNRRLLLSSPDGGRQLLISFNLLLTLILTLVLSPKSPSLVQNSLSNMDPKPSSSVANIARALLKPKKPSCLSVKAHNMKKAKTVSSKAKTGSFHGSRKDLLDNYNNLSKSGVPQRVLYFSEGEWVDFNVEATSILKEAFQRRETVVELVLVGIVYIVDFLHMMEVDLGSGFLTSIAWIDVDGKCFFPRVVVCKRDGRLCCPSQIDVRIKVKAKAKAKALGTRLVGDREEEKQSSSSNSIGISSQSEVSSGSSGGCLNLRGNLIMVGADEAEFALVRDKFMDGMGKLARLTSVVGIHRNLHRTVSGQSRLEAFRMHADEMVKKCGGNANVRYGWHGTSKSGVSGILLHGFGQPCTPKNGAAFGSGVYLAPEHCSYVSVAYSDVDENGEQHMLLCRLILGNVEQVKPGSGQFHPSSEQFDTGVDDLQNPKRYIVWSTHMNTHILPEYIVSFKLPPQLHEYWSSLKVNRNTINRQGNPNYSLKDVQSASPNSMQKMDPSQQSVPQAVKDPSHQMRGNTLKPTSPWMPIATLLSVIEKFLSSSSIQLLKKQYDDYQASKINREDLVRRFRMIAGDRLLTSVLKMFQDQVPQTK